MEETQFQPGDEPVPGFMLRKPLGAGAFGEVWEARAPGDVKVAIKILSGIDRKAGRKAFRALQLVKNLNHPHLVTIVGFWLKDEKGNLLQDDVDPNFSEDSVQRDSDTEDEFNGPDPKVTMTPEDIFIEELPDNIPEGPGAAERPAQLFIAMSLAEETLEQCLERYQKKSQQEGRRRAAPQLDGIPREELLHYLEGAAKGLDFLNKEHELQHGDVKPANIMIISGEGQVSDFDLARSPEDPRATSTVMGSMAYMGPEVYDNEPSAYSDQYSLAITYYELRTGKLPYRKESCKSVIRDKVTGQLDLSLLPKDERKVIRRATSVHPTARYGGCLDMVKELRGRERTGLLFLKYAAMLLFLLLASIGAWERLAPRGYKLTDYVRPFFGPDRVREDLIVELRTVTQSLAQDQNKLSSSSDVVKWLGNFERVLKGAKENERLDFRKWNAILMDEALTVLQRQLLKCGGENPPQDAKEFLKGELLTAIDTHLHEESPNWLAGRNGVEDIWEWKLELARSRAQFVQSDSRDDFGGSDVAEKLLAPLRPGVFDSLEPAYQDAILAIRVIRAESEAGSTPLVRGVVEPLAELVKRDSDTDSLTTTERQHIGKIAKTIQHEADEAIRNSEGNSSPWEATITDDLVVITGLPIALLLEINKLETNIRTATTSDDFRQARVHFKNVSNDFTSLASSQNVLARDYAPRQRLEELELLLFLKDPDSQALPGAERPDVAEKTSPAVQIRKVLVDRSLYNAKDYGLFCHALLNRAERSVLGTLVGSPIPLDVVHSVLQSQNTEANLGERRQSYRTWLSWIRGVANINPQGPEYKSYAAWKELFSPADLDSEVGERVSLELAAIVELCRAECLVGLDEPLSAEQREQLQQSLDRLSGEDLLRHAPYYHFCRMLNAYLTTEAESDNGDLRDNEEAQQALLQAIQELFGDLQHNDTLKTFLRERPARAQLAMRIVRGAALADRRSAGEYEKQEEAGVRNPFREGGAELSWPLLQFVCNEFISKNGPRDEETAAASENTQARDLFDDNDLDRLLGVTAAAGYFKDQPNYASAAQFADRRIHRYTPDGSIPGPEIWNCLLISARAHASAAEHANQSGTQQSEQLAHETAAIHSFSLLADWFGDSSARENARISTAAYLDMLLDGITISETSRLGTLIENVSNQSRIPHDTGEEPEKPTSAEEPGGLDGPRGDQLRRDAARIYSAAASCLPESRHPELPEQIEDRKRTRAVYFKLASTLEPQDPGHLVDYAVSALGLPEMYNNPEDEIEFLRDITHDLSQKPTHPGRHLLEGRLYVLEARRAVSVRDQVRKYENALNCLRNLKTNMTQYQAIWELTNAAAKLELANALGELDEEFSGTGESPKQLLENAIAHCKRLSTMPEPRKKLLHMPFVYMAWGNAVEDLQYLAAMPGKYKEALEIFEIGREETGHDKRYQHLFDLNVARCIFRMYLAANETAESLLRDVIGAEKSVDLATLNTHTSKPENSRLFQVFQEDFQDDADIRSVTKTDVLRIAERLLRDAIEEGIEDKKVRAESYLYLARIYERHALKEQNAEQRLDKLEESADFLEQAVATAYAAGLRERYFWKLEYAETAVSALIPDISQQEHEKWTRRAKRAVDDILAGSDSMMSTDTVLREHCRIALSAIVKVLMWGLVLDRNEILEYAVTEKIPDSDSDIRAHLVLRQAQYACDKLSDYDDREKTREIVEQDLSRAQSIVDTLPDVSLGEPRDIWAARIAGQRAILEYRIFWLSLRDRNVSEKDSSKLGVAAFEKLNHVTEIFEQLRGEAPQQDAAYLRYLQGLIAVKIKDANLDDLINKAKGELNRIAKDEWDSRAAALCKRTDLLEGWSWGVWEAAALTHLPNPPERPHKRPKEYASTVLALAGQLN